MTHFTHSWTAIWYFFVGQKTSYFVLEYGLTGQRFFFCSVKDDFFGGAFCGRLISSISFVLCKKGRPSKMDWTCHVVNDCEDFSDEIACCVKSCRKYFLYLIQMSSKVFLNQWIYLTFSAQRGRMFDHDFKGDWGLIRLC